MEMNAQDKHQFIVRMISSMKYDGLTEVCAKLDISSDGTSEEILNRLVGIANFSLRYSSDTNENFALAHAQTLDMLLDASCSTIGYGHNSVDTRSSMNPFISVEKLISSSLKLFIEPASGLFSATSFTVSDEDFVKLQKSSLKKKLGNGDLRLLLRSYKVLCRHTLLPIPNDQSDCLWPNDVEVVVNGIKWKSDNNNQYCGPLDLFQYIKAGINEISVSSQDSNSFDMLIQMTKHKGVWEISKEIEDKNRMSEEESTERVIEYLKKEQTGETGYTITLKCPISKENIIIPARGRNCEHIQCFDLPSFIQSHEKNMTQVWQCNICKCPIEVKDIIVDTYMHQILKDARKMYVDPQKVELFKDGNWKVIKELPVQKYENKVKVAAMKSPTNKLNIVAEIEAKEEEEIIDLTSDHEQYALPKIEKNGNGQQKKNQKKRAPWRGNQGGYDELVGYEMPCDSSFTYTNGELHSTNILRPRKRPSSEYEDIPYIKRDKYY